MDELSVWIDPNNFDKVLYNVLSNAIKFTPGGGHIEIQLKAGQDDQEDAFLHEYALISVTDTGIGIEEDKISRIFDRFYQIAGDQKTNPGTGIGLHLSQTLMEMQSGRIYARNRKDKSGSIFCIQIPLGDKHVGNAEIEENPELSQSLMKAARYTEHLNTDKQSKHDHIKPFLSKKKTPFKVLIADDDDQMRKFIRQELEASFVIIDCANGREALDLVHTEKPDLVISDIVMPIMDGNTLCKKIKSNPITSHLPVVLLTVKTDLKDRAHGLDAGADAYLVKPFNVNILRKNIENLLENRERIVSQFGLAGNIRLKAKTYSSDDEALVNKVVKIIESHMSDHELNVMVLSKEVGMSRVHLYRKIKKITGQSISDVIRNIRLQKAAQLLEGRKGFVKEVAYEVGFTSLSHFSRAFHDYHGVSPSKYANQNKSKYSDDK